MSASSQNPPESALARYKPETILPLPSSRISQHSSPANSCAAWLESLHDLFVDTESAARESLGILENHLIVEVNHSLAHLRLSLHNCRQAHLILSTTPWYIYPFAVLRLLWSIRAASRTARDLLHKIQSQGEVQIRRRLQGDVERTR
ncbi:hypothetical protein C8J56DRAFT_1066026 [Mycena floridula]|nr:hypothetical protein C8J56DRAFT_1066026 [Mycena floridula]